MTSKILIFLCFILLSCSSVKKWALSTSSGLMLEGIDSIYYESDYHIFKNSALANLKTLETLHYANREDEKLLAELIKGYSGYAYGVLETEAFGEVLGQEVEGPLMQRLKSAYTRAVDYGFYYLELKGIKKDKVLREGSNYLRPKIEALSSPHDKKALFYFAQSFAALLNIDKQNIYLVAQSSLVTDIIDHVCDGDDEFENGACSLFYASYEAARPALLGGNMQKASKLFKALMKESPYNLLIKVNYIQFYLIPMIEDTSYYKLKTELISDFSQFQRVNDFGQKINKKIKYPRRFNLFNGIAYERFKKIIELEEELF